MDPRAVRGVSATSPLLLWEAPTATTTSCPPHKIHFKTNNQHQIIYNNHNAPAANNQTPSSEISPGCYLPPWGEISHWNQNDSIVVAQQVINNTVKSMPSVVPGPNPYNVIPLPQQGFVQDGDRNVLRMNAPNPRIFISTFTVKTTKPFTITVDVSKAWMKALSLSDVDICRAAANGTWYSKRQYQPMTLCGHLFTFGSWAQEYSYDDDVLRFVCSGCKYNCSSPIDPFYTLLHYYVIRFATDISAQSNPFILRKGNTHKPGLLEECQAPSTFPQTAAVWPFVTPRMIQPRRTARALKHPISDNIVGRPSPVSPLPLNEGETDNNSSLYQKPPCSQLPSAPNPRISISTFTVETTKPFTMTVDVSKAWMKAMSLSDEDICRAAANGTCYSKRQYQPMTPCGQLFTIGSWSKESFPDGDNVRFVCSGCKYNCSSPIDPFYTPLQYYVICFATDVSAQSNSFVIRKGNTPKPKPLEECQVSKELPEKHQHEEQASEEEQQAAEPQQSSCSMTPRMIKKRRTGTSGVEESPVSGIVGPPSPSVTPLPLDMI